MPVSTLRFIQGAVAQRRARYRLRDLLVLLFRTAAILLLAFAIARPLMHQRKVEDATEDAQLTRIVLLDCSQSMAARDGGIIRFERARPVVSNLLKYEASMKANLLLAGANPSPVFDGPTTNLTALREALAEADVRPLLESVLLGAEELVETLLECEIYPDLSMRERAPLRASSCRGCGPWVAHLARALPSPEPNVGLLGVELSSGVLDGGRGGEVVGDGGRGQEVEPR